MKTTTKKKTKQKKQCDGQVVIKLGSSSVFGNHPDKLND